MNRRTAIFSTFLLGGFLSRVCRGQQRREGPRFDPVEPSIDDRALEPGARRSIPSSSEALRPPQGLDAELRREQQLRSQEGFDWFVEDITEYTSLPHASSTERPEQALIEWIFRFTGSGVWFGEDLTVLSATPSQLRAFHNQEIREQVREVSRRFLDPWFHTLTMQVRVVLANDPNWRYEIFSELEPTRLAESFYGGPHGQQAWTIDADAAKLLLVRSDVERRFQTVVDRRFEVVNGQTAVLRSQFREPTTYRAGLDRASRSAVGFEQRVEALNEGVSLRVSPLLRPELTTVDLAVDFSATAVRRFLPTSVIVPRQTGLAEMTIDVPEVAHTRLNRTIEAWPLEQTLILSAGVLPGFLSNRGGLLNLIPQGKTELLVFLDIRSNLDSARVPDRERR